MIELSVILLGYNEQENIEASVRSCDSALDRLGITYEIIVVNDGSNDRTGEIADELAANLSFVRVIHNPINLNVGSSLLIGMRAARGRFVTHNSMDLPFDPAEIGRLVEKFGSSDVVVVVRTGRSAHSLWRQITSLTHHWIVRLLFFIDVRDMNFVQAYRREILADIPVRARSPAFVTPELIIRALRRGYRITEVEAHFHKRRFGKANFGKPRDILWTLADMLSFRLEGEVRGRSPKVKEGLDSLNR